MLVIVCPCGENLGNKEVELETQLMKACDKMGLDFNAISEGIDRTPEFKAAKQEIVNKLVRRLCCKVVMMNYIDTVKLIKG